MEAPSQRWHKVVFDDNTLDRIEENLSECEDDLVEYVSMRYEDGVNEFETPESVAFNIGSHADSMHTDHIRPLVSDSGPTGEKMILGYVGSLVIEKTD